MNRWTHPVQFMQQALDRHQAYIKELQKITKKLEEEIERIKETKADRKGRKPQLTQVK